MNKKTKRVLIATGIAALSAGTLAFMITPEKPTEEQVKPFIGRNYAHRGLHKIDKTVPENSILAFEKAAEAGYGVELDVRITADDRVVVFHDDDLERICGVSGCVEIMTWQELCELRLHDTDETIPLLSDALRVMAGKAPVIIELKRNPRNKELCSQTLDIIRRSGAEVCIQSFDPTILGWYKRKAPDILRGQLTNSKNALKKGETPGFVGSLLSKMLTNFISRPNYIAHGLDKKSMLVRVCEKMGVMRVAWTSRTPGYEADNDAVIFEHYKPRARFK